MKKIEAIIKPYKFNDVRVAMAEVGVEGMTLTEVKGWGHQKGRTELHAELEYRVDFVPKIKVETVVRDEEAQAVVEAIVRAAKTGSFGDGKVFVSEVEDAIRVRTSEHGVWAVA
jgi:nitrogen regulatory protein P-II 1